METKDREKRYKKIQEKWIKARGEVVWLILSRDWYIDETNDKEVTWISRAWEEMDKLVRDIVRDIVRTKKV